MGVAARELVILIGWRVLAGDLLDYVRFRAVCSDWKSSTVCPRGRGLVDPRFHPRHWMMLPEGHGLYPGHPNLRGYVRFFNLTTGAFVRVHLPLFNNHTILDSIDGLLLLHRHPDTAVRLLHPLIGKIAELPPLLSLVQQMQVERRRVLINCVTEDIHLRQQLGIFLRGISAAVAISTTGVISVMISLHMISESRRVAYAAAGDQRWTLSTWKLPSLLTRPTFLEGKLYAVSDTSAGYQGDNQIYLYRLDPPLLTAEGLHLLPPVMIASCPLAKAHHSTHLVVCDSELMIVNLNGPLYAYPNANLVVYRLTDLIGGRVIPVKDIGEHAFFIERRGVCVSTNKGHPWFSGNTITCINRFRFDDDNIADNIRVEQYHLSSGTWSPAMDRDIMCRGITPASPYTLAHHIFTCCCCSYWNKGLIVCSAITPQWSVKPNLWIQRVDGSMVRLFA